jgi:hypothetical protein
MLNCSGVVVRKKDDGDQVAVVCSNHDAFVMVLFWLGAFYPSETGLKTTPSTKSQEVNT